MRKELIWILSIAVFSVFITGLLTSFQFDSLDIQLHDTYYVIDSFTLIVVLILIMAFVGVIVSSIRFLKNKSIYIRLSVVLIVSAILLVPVMALYMFIMVQLADK